MGKLHDIKGYWNMSGDYNFNDTDMWEGKIILEDDGWFEGIVCDPHSSYTGDRMVFGVYHPNKVIELLKVTPAKVSDPFVFRGVRDAKGYDGTFSLIDFFGETLYGASHLITRDVALSQEDGCSEVKDRDIEAEKQELLQRLKTFKSNNDFKELYENTLAMRECLSEEVLKLYRSAKKERQDAKKRVKKQLSILICPDDELPF